MSWTDDRVELLKKMWAEGNSASAIAKELGGVTRNAVIGKVHRLGLSNRATAKAAEEPKAAAPKPEPKVEPAPARPAPAAPAAPAAAAPSNVTPLPPRRPVGIPGQPLPPQPTGNEINPETLANIAEFEKSAKKLTLMQLTERTCKWPIGDPATDEFWFCGHPCAPGKPYCEQHVSIAFQPMSSRRDRRASR
ncbi:MAG: GcrA family cell cycle regulator [Pseudomonadota bacterium]